jgi:NitT/TauT family transport system substrate-binding protein
MTSGRGSRMRTSRVGRPAWSIPVAVLATLGLLATACGEGDGGDGGVGGVGGVGAEGERASVKLILGWFAGPQFGGFFAAEQQGFYDDAGLDVQIEGGSVESPIQIVAAGTAQFGFGDADELVQARAQEIPVVGVFANYQTALRILVYHQEEALTGFDDLSGRTMFVDLGDAWWEYIVQKFDLKDVEEREYNAQGFLQDKSAVIQGYAGDELELAHADPTAQLEVMRVADSGWNPYMQVMFTTEKFLSEQPDVVKRFVEASVRGWEYYRQNFEEVNAYLEEQGAEAPVDVMSEQAKIYEPYIFEGGFPAQMSADRWVATVEALKLTGVLEEDVDVSKAFTNEYLPAG